MVSDTSPVGYIASSSSVSTPNSAYRAFDKNNVNYFQSAETTSSPPSGGGFSLTFTNIPTNLPLYSSYGVYNGSEITHTNIGSVGGEWIQIQLPSEINIVSYTIDICDITTGAPPSTFYFLYSLDNGPFVPPSWILAGIESKFNWENNSNTFNLITPITSRFFRISCTEVGAGLAARSLTIKELTLNQTQTQLQVSTVLSNKTYYDFNNTNELVSKLYVDGVDLSSRQYTTNYANSIVTNQSIAINNRVDQVVADSQSAITNAYTLLVKDSLRIKFPTLQQRTPPFYYHYSSQSTHTVAGGEDYVPDITAPTNIESVYEFKYFFWFSSDSQLVETMKCMVNIYIGEHDGVRMIAGQNIFDLSIKQGIKISSGIVYRGWTPIMFTGYIFFKSGVGTNATKVECIINAEGHPSTKRWWALSESFVRNNEMVERTANISTVNTTTNSKFFMTMTNLDIFGNEAVPDVAMFVCERLFGYIKRVDAVYVLG